jgi:hypothetical protein
MGKVRRTREKSYVSQAVPNNPDVDPHPLTKKDKRKLKHEQLIKKLQASQKDKSNAAQPKQQPLLTFDVMANTLQDIATKPVEVPKQSSGRVSQAKKKQILAAERAQYSAVLHHDVFNADPTATVATHLHNSIQLQRHSN